MTAALWPSETLVVHRGAVGCWRAELFEGLLLALLSSLSATYISTTAKPTTTKKTKKQIRLIVLSLSGVLEARKTHTDSDNTPLWWFVIVPVIDIHCRKE